MTKTTSRSSKQKENILKTLSDQLVETAEQSREKIPADARSIMNKATQDLQATGIEGRVLQNGQKVPSFILKNHLNNDRNLETMLADGPVVVSFSTEVVGDLTAIWSW